MRSQLRPESPRSCVFCGRRPLTREHIFPFWLRDAVGGVGVATNYMTDGGEAWPSVGEPLTYQRQWRANEAGIVARCVCGECNSGWMNDLDHGVKERLVPLVGGAAEELDAGARQRLATWAAKIGILLENTRGVSDLTRRRALIPPKRQRELFELRLPPSCSQIWLAQVRPLVPGAWWRTSPVPLAAFDVEAARFYGAPNASLTTFAIG